MADKLQIAHLVATLLMTGVVLFVAVVHYPLFASVGAREFATYSERHQRRTSLVVVPLMTAELLLAVMLFTTEAAPRTVAIAGLVLLAVIWLTTFLRNVPLHSALQRLLTEEGVKKQVFWHWVRTLAWCARSALAIAIVARGA